jgi:hypothetical protein
MSGVPRVMPDARASRTGARNVSARFADKELVGGTRPSGRARVIRRADLYCSRSTRPRVMPFVPRASARPRMPRRIATRVRHG